ncbi:MAG: lamin tail domain-containing protein [Phycisphaerales bacterium]|nr:lamin tail domain-containing protein [Phycisphaerales bacterium]
MRHALTLAAIAFAGTTANAGLSITEIYAGMTGEDGTIDWIEVTNTSGAAIDTGSFYYDDESRSINDGGLLDSYMLGAGESAIFLISDDNEASDDVTYASAIAEFVSIWNYAGFVGLTNGGGNLSQNGDEAVLMTGTAGSEVIESAAAFGTGFANSGATIDFVSGSPVDSVLGVNGAYESNLFFNDNFSFPNDMTSLVGSVGLVPSPGAFAVFMTCGLLGARRRR